MQQAPIKERLDFYRFCSAGLLFEHCLDILNVLYMAYKEERLPENYTALIRSFVVAYAKPFGQKRDETLGVGLRITEDHDLVPPCFLHFHKGLIDYRNKMYAHTDITELKYDAGGKMNALNVVIENGTPKFALIYSFYDPAEYPNLRVMLEQMIIRAGKKTIEIWDSWKANLPHEGHWKVNDGLESDDVFISVS